MQNHYGIIGNPIHHSLSPRIHRLFAEQFDLSLNYEPILVQPNTLESTLKHFQQQHGKGLNVTLPFKQKVFGLVDHCSERATHAGAINTLSFHADGSVFGDNTDGAGLVRDLMYNHLYSLQAKNILILGAGGAARGVLLPILQQNPQSVVITNRTASKAIELAQACANKGNVYAQTFAQLAELKFDLIINATSASLQQINLPLPDGILAEHAFCYDMVYSNAGTVFLTWAKKNGAHHCADGMGMLLEQAAESFYLWHKLRPDTQPVLKILRMGE